MKVKIVFRWIIICSSLLFALLMICPLVDELRGYEVIFNDYHLAIAYFLPIIGCLILLLKKYIKNVEFISMICLGTGSVFYLFHLIDNKTTNLFIILAIVLEFIYSLLLIYILNDENEFSVRDIVETAMLIALAIGLDLPGVKIRIGVNGGSISFTMLPLMILALRLGSFKGFIGTGLVYGAITCTLDGWGMQYFLFDYLLAYGSIAIIGIFAPIIYRKDGKYPWFNLIFVVVGITLACAARLLFATLSGVIFYETGFVESLAYNALYILPSGGACLAAMLLLFKPLLIVHERFPVERTTF